MTAQENENDWNQNQGRLVTSASNLRQSRLILSLMRKFRVYFPLFGILKNEKRKMKNEKKNLDVVVIFNSWWIMSMFTYHYSVFIHISISIRFLFSTLWRS